MSPGLSPCVSNEAFAGRLPAARRAAPPAPPSARRAGRLGAGSWRGQAADCRAAARGQRLPPPLRGRGAGGRAARAAGPSVSRALGRPVLPLRTPRRAHGVGRRETRPLADPPPLGPRRPVHGAPVPRQVGPVGRRSAVVEGPDPGAAGPVRAARKPGGRPGSPRTSSLRGRARGRSSSRGRGRRAVRFRELRGAAALSGRRGGAEGRQASGKVGGPGAAASPTPVTETRH